MSEIRLVSEIIALQKKVREEVSEIIALQKKVREECE